MGGGLKSCLYRVHADARAGFEQVNEPPCANGLVQLVQLSRGRQGREWKKLCGPYQCRRRSASVLCIVHRLSDEVRSSEPHFLQWTLMVLL